MKLSKIEQETIILFNEAEAEAEVYTHNKSLKRRLENAAKKNPTLYHLKDKNAHGGVSYTFPKKYLKIVFRDEASEEEQRRYNERMEKARSGIKANKNTAITPSEAEVRQTPDQEKNE